MRTCSSKSPDMIGVNTPVYVLTRPITQREEVE
jgi:hypothetical protein